MRRTVKYVEHKSNRLVRMWNTNTSWNTEHCSSSVFIIIF